MGYSGRGGRKMSEYDVSVRKAGFGSFDVTANSENAQKLLGKGTFTYEESEWKKLNKELRNYTYTIEVRWYEGRNLDILGICSEPTLGVFKMWSTHGRALRPLACDA